MTALLTSGSAERVAGRSSHVVAPPRPALRPVRRTGRGRLGPPGRPRVAGAPHVVARPDCAPRRAPAPIAVLVGIAAVVALAVYGLGAFAGSVAGGADVPEATTVVRVAPGESLSELAGRMAPGSDIEAVVAKIRELNSLTGSDVAVGQPLTVPFLR
ncbi:LysM peptidoglycan-binding domain-containing protein [Actinokineospora sp.]|uniref:LysM peptidoglycan-binding domain-containing protein n=1 Tax=Actinokineospora sp. TaxID=1872133 RepID=UPI00403812CA